MTKQHDTIPKAAPVRSEALRRIKAMGLWPQKLPYTDVVDVIIKEIRA